MSEAFMSQQMAQILACYIMMMMMLTTTMMMMMMMMMMVVVMVNLSYLHRYFRTYEGCKILFSKTLHFVSLFLLIN
jgi:hypothetical protein